MATATTQTPPPQTAETKRAKATEAEALLSKTLDALREGPDCWHPVLNHDCVSRDWGTTSKGAPKFWYGSDCKLPAEKFCNPCLAYWHVAIARNIALSMIRAEALAEAEAQREAQRAVSK